MKDTGGWAIGNREMHPTRIPLVVSLHLIYSSAKPRFHELLRVKALVHILDYEMHPNIL